MSWTKWKTSIKNKSIKKSKKNKKYPALFNKAHARTQTARWAEPWTRLSFDAVFATLSQRCCARPIILKSVNPNLALSQVCCCPCCHTSNTILYWTCIKPRQYLSSLSYCSSIVSCYARLYRVSMLINYLDYQKLY